MYTLNLSAGQLEVITSLLEAEISSILDEIRYAPETMHQYQDELIELVDLQDQIDYVFDAEDESYSDVCEDCSVSYSDDEEETEYNDEDYQFKTGIFNKNLIHLTEKNLMQCYDLLDLKLFDKNIK